MQKRAKAFWVTEPGNGEIRDEVLPLPTERDVVVQALYSGISRGTEALVFGGHVPQSEWDRMRAPFQVGDFPSPVKYGYASVGRVIGGPDTLKNQLVFVLHPHQTHFIVPATAVYAVPDGVPPARAVLAANLETALNGVWDAKLHLGDRISVVGAGAVGCLTAWLASGIPGCEVELVDTNPRRAEVARVLGVRFAEPRIALDGADVVIHASGVPAGLNLALELAATEARIVELSWFGDQSVSLPLGSAFHARRLTIQSSQVGRVAPGQRARWDMRRRMELALRLLSEARLDALITGESAFETLPSLMAQLTEKPGDTLCHRIRYV